MIHHVLSPAPVPSKASRISQRWLSCTKPTVAIDLSDAVIVDSSNVYYQELEDSPTPGVCVESDGGTSTWSPIKISKRHVKPASSDTSDDDIDIDDCLSFDYQLRDGVPGFEIETRDDCFWAPILNRRTRSRKKSLVAAVDGWAFNALLKRPLDTANIARKAVLHTCTDSWPMGT